MDTLQDLFAREGRTFPAAGGKHFLLDDPGVAWMVLEGVLDVFVTPTRQGAPAGPREFVCTLAPGQGALGLTPPEPADEAGETFLFEAVGRSGATVATLPLERLQESYPEHHNALALLVDGFLDGLSRGLVSETGLAPKGQEFLPVGETVALPDAAYACVHDAPVWISGQGCLTYMHHETFILLKENAPIPVTHHAWIQVHTACATPESTSQGRGAPPEASARDSEKTTSPPQRATLRCASTAEVLAAGTFAPGFAAFQTLLFDLLHKKARVEEAHALAAMQERVRSDAQGRDAGLHRLAGLLGDDHEAGAMQLSDHAREEALIAACEVVAGVLHLSIKPPLQSARAGLGLTVAEIASASGIRTRMVALRDTWWKLDAGPMVAHVGEDRCPVALVFSRKGCYEMIDPAAQTRRAVTATLASDIGDFAHVFYAHLPERPVTGRELLRFGLREAGADLRRIALMGLPAGLLGLIPPVIMATVINDVVPYAEHSRLLQLTGIMLACAVGVAGMDFVRNVAVLRISSRLHAGVEVAVMDRVLRMPLPFFRRQASGDLAERLMGATRMREVLSVAIVAAILSGSFAFCSFFLLFHYHSTLAWWALLLIGLYVAVIGFSWTVQLRYRRRLTAVEGRLSGKVLQFITGIPKLRASGSEGRAFSIWATIFGQQRALAYKAEIADKGLATFNSVFPVLASMGLFFGIVHYSSTTTMDAGSFIAFNTAFGNVLLGLTAITSSMTMCLYVWPYAERMLPILAEPPEASLEKADPGELTGCIEIAGLTFRYREDTPVVLNDVSLCIEPGEFVAITGASGSGKSTLMRLLLGFETPTSGSILFDDKDLKDLDPGKVRHNMGVVIQNSQVMPGDIYHNIAGARQVSMDDAWEAASKVGLHDDIKAMPMGMHTVVTEGGSTLSGGQRQRLLIARALVNRPRILMLDEATSALDNRTQAIVSESLASIKATRIVVAHRLSTIKEADRIIVLEHGEIRESGTYGELMQLDGAFARLARRQVL